MDLVEQLKEIADMKKFDYIVIEASGICEPAPIAQTICSIPSLGPEYIKNGVLRLDSIVTVVDALRMKDEFANGDDLMKDNIDEEDLASLVIQQIEFCNIILLNKAAEVEPKELEKLKQIIRAIQPKAEIFECNYGDVDLDKIVNTKSLIGILLLLLLVGYRKSKLSVMGRKKMNIIMMKMIMNIMMKKITTSMSIITTIMKTSMNITMVTSITTIMITTMRKVKLKSMALEHSFITAVSHSTWVCLMSLSPENGLAML